MSNRLIETTLLNAVASTQTTSAFTPQGANRAFQVVISATATVVLQGSLDGANWFNLRTSTASEAYSTSEPWTFVRADVTWTSGTVSLFMAVVGELVPGRVYK